MSVSPTSNDDDIYHLDGDDDLDTMSNTPPHLLTSEPDDEDDEELHDPGRDMSLLSIHSPADEDDDNIDAGVSRPMWIKGKYDSENDSPGVNSRRKETRCRQRSLNRAWETRRCNSGDTRRREFGSPEGDLECRLMVRPRGREVGISMDMEEVRACRDLGLTLPRDWTVEISGARDTSSGGSSPISDWRISSPGDSPKDIKARLKVWAQAVALASTSRLSN